MNGFEVDLSQDTLLTKKEVAQRLSIGVRALEKHIAEGNFPPKAVGLFGRPRWTIRQLNAWLNGDGRTDVPDEILSIESVCQHRLLGRPSVVFEAETRIEHGHYVGGIALNESVNDIRVDYARNISGLIGQTTRIMLVGEDHQFIEPTRVLWGKNWTTISHDKPFSRLFAATPYKTIQ